MATIGDIYIKTEESHRASEYLLDQPCIILSLFNFPWGRGGGDTKRYFKSN